MYIGCMIISVYCQQCSWLGGPDPPELPSGVHVKRKKSGENFFRTGGGGGAGQPLMTNSPGSLLNLRTRLRRCLLYITVLDDSCVLQESDGVDEEHVSCVSRLSPVADEFSLSLWHALDVWRCVVQLGRALESATESLAACERHLLFSSW